MTKKQVILRFFLAVLAGTTLFMAGFYTGGRVQRAQAGVWDKLVDLAGEAKKLNSSLKDLESNIQKLKQNAADIKEVRDKLDPTYKKDQK